MTVLICEAVRPAALKRLSGGGGGHVDHRLVWGRVTTRDDARALADPLVG